MSKYQVVVGLCLTLLGSACEFNSRMYRTEYDRASINYVARGQRVLDSVVNRDFTSLILAPERIS